jgi:hypothetical protein
MAAARGAARNPRVFFDVAIAAKPRGRITFEVGCRRGQHAAYVSVSLSAAVLGQGAENC